jgi:quercetin dioxygenase-like cupin family protein
MSHAHVPHPSLLTQVVLRRFEHPDEVRQMRCHVEHVGLVLAGQATAAFDDGRVHVMSAGELFYIPPVPHDSRVLGDDPSISLHFLGADHYATPGDR